MSHLFFDHPILNSPYACPQRHWELDADGQPTQRVLERRRRAEFITPIPKPKKRKTATPGATQGEIVFDEGKGLSTQAQQYDPTSIINDVRQYVSLWRACPTHSGRSALKRHVSSGTGGTTRSAVSAHSSVRWKPSKPPSG